MPPATAIVATEGRATRARPGRTAAGRTGSTPPASPQCLLTPRRGHVRSWQTHSAIGADLGPARSAARGGGQKKRPRRPLARHAGGAKKSVRGAANQRSPFGSVPNRHPSPRSRWGTLAASAHSRRASCPPFSGRTPLSATRPHARVPVRARARRQRCCWSERAAGAAGTRSTSPTAARGRAIGQGVEEGGRGGAAAPVPAGSAPATPVGAAVAAVAVPCCV